MFATWFQNVAILRLEYKTEEFWVSGDMAIQIGTAEGTVQPVGATPTSDRNGFMGIWIRGAEGRWRAHRNVFNSHLPLPAPSAVSR
jgi:ketosteroid isomerase-like protein